jgi:Family of unknown function (DUF6174)
MMKTVAFFLSFIFVGGSTKFDVVAQNVDSEPTKLASAKTKWEALQSDLGPLDYKYGFTDASSRTELSTSYIVLVEKDRVAEVEPIYWSNRQPDPAKFSTVNDLFDLIESNLESGSRALVVYDDVYGYPLEITIINDDAGVRVIYAIDPMTLYTVAQAELRTNMALWNKTSSKDYDYTLRLSCFCIPSATLPKRIEVRGGEIETILDVESGLESENFFFNTLDAQFEEIQDAINDRLYIITTSYNDTSGYPTSVYFDVHPGMSDDERLIEITDVVILDLSGEGRIDSSFPTDAPSIQGTENTTDLEMDFSLFPTVSPTTPAPTIWSSAVACTFATAFVSTALVFLVLEIV